MKEILRIMRFDYLTVRPTARPVILFTGLLFFLIGLLFAPMVCCYFSFGLLTLITPLGGVADKCGFEHLYGMLPVSRKNVARGRFLYIFTVLFLAQVLEFLMILLAVQMKLYRFLPHVTNKMRRLMEQGFSSAKLGLFITLLLFAFFTVIFAYMEMLGQIHGRENDMKYILITLGVLTLLGFAFAMLSEHDIIPAISLPSLPETTAGMLGLVALVDGMVLALCVLFGEITAAAIQKRLQ